MSDKLTDLPHIGQFKALVTAYQASTQGEWSADAVLGRYETDICAPSTPETGSPNLIGHFVDESDDAVQAQRDTLWTVLAHNELPNLLRAYSAVVGERDALREEVESWRMSEQHWQESMKESH